MTCETWLRPNRRALLFGMIPPGVAAALGVAILATYPAAAGNGGLRLAGWLLLALAGAALGLLAFHARQPRVGFTGRHLRLLLRAVRPTLVPVEEVEGFLLGSGPTGLPAAHDDQPQARNLVVRMSPQAEEFVRQDVHPALGAWCDSYVTIRGMWCEPLSIALVNRLNQQLAAAQRELAGKEDQA